MCSIAACTATTRAGGRRVVQKHNNSRYRHWNLCAMKSWFNSWEMKWENEKLLTHSFSSVAQRPMSSCPDHTGLINRPFMSAGDAGLSVTSLLRLFASLILLCVAFSTMFKSHLSMEISDRDKQQLGCSSHLSQQSNKPNLSTKRGQKPTGCQRWAGLLYKAFISHVNWDNIITSVVLHDDLCFRIRENAFLLQVNEMFQSHKLKLNTVWFCERYCSLKSVGCRQLMSSSLSGKTHSRCRGPGDFCWLYIPDMSISHSSEAAALRIAASVTW